MREPLSVPGTSNSPWPHIGVYRQSYERLELADGEDDEDGLVAGALPRAAQLGSISRKPRRRPSRSSGVAQAAGAAGMAGAVGVGMATPLAVSALAAAPAQARLAPTACRPEARHAPTPSPYEEFSMSSDCRAPSERWVVRVRPESPVFPAWGCRASRGVPRGGGGTGTGGGIGAGIGPGVGSGVGGGPSGEATNGELAPEGGGPTGLSASSIAGAAAALGLPLPQAAPASAAPTGPATARTAAGGEGTATPVEPPPSTPTRPRSPKRSTCERRGSGDEQAVVGYLLQIAEGSGLGRRRHRGPSRRGRPAASRRQPRGHRPPLEMGGNLTQRRTFLADASAGHGDRRGATPTVAAAQIPQQAI